MSPLYIMHLPLEKNVAFRLNNLNLIRSPKDALCQVWLKLVSGSREEIILKSVIKVLLLHRLYFPFSRAVDNRISFTQELVKLAQWL